MNKSIDPHSMIITLKYYITDPCYDDYEEDLTPQTDLVEVIAKNKNHVILKSLNDGITYERTYQHLLNCEIEIFLK